MKLDFRYMIVNKLFLTPLLIIWSLSSCGQVLYKNSFGDPTVLKQTYGIEAASDSSVKIDKLNGVNGRSSVRFELNSTDRVVSTSKRSEMVIYREKRPNVERWVRMGVMVPDETKQDTSQEIIAQWHAIPDLNLGEKWRSPPMSLRIQNGNFYLDLKWANQRVNSNNTLTGSRRLLIGKLIPGHWYEMIFHIKFSYNKDGFVDLWKDGEKVISYKGPNYYNDFRGPFLKLGIYKWEWMSRSKRAAKATRVVYFNDVLIADETANFTTIKNFRF